MRILSFFYLIILSMPLVGAAASWPGQPNGVIWFHPNTQPYYPFSNFFEIDRHRDTARYPVTGLHNRTPFYSLQIGLPGLPLMSWRSSEHFFQAIKFVRTANLSDLNQQWNAFTPAAIFRAARSSQYQIIPEWDNVKLYVMYAAIKAKFFQNRPLATLLSQTNDTWLVEHVLPNPKQPHGDNYWGDTNGGHNYLGKVLMMVRKQLRRENTYPAGWSPAQHIAMRQAETAVQVAQQAWVNAGLPIFVNRRGELLAFQAFLTQEGNTNWLKNQVNEHPIRSAALGLLGAGIIGGAVEIAWYGKHPSLLKIFRRKNPQRTLFGYE